MYDIDYIMYILVLVGNTDIWKLQKKLIKIASTSFRCFDVLKRGVSICLDQINYWFTIFSKTGSLFNQIDQRQKKSSNLLASALAADNLLLKSLIIMKIS